MPGPYLRWWPGCQATHMYEMPFRLAALHAGLELEPGTSPPVVRRIPRSPAGQVGAVARAADEPADDGRVDLIRSLLHLLGPMSVKQAATYLDSPTKEVQARWPRTPCPCWWTASRRSCSARTSMRCETRQSPRSCACSGRSTCSCRVVTAG